MKRKKTWIFAVAAGACAGSRALFVCKKKKNADADEESEKALVLHGQGCYEKYIKRPLDFCCAVGAILILWPVMAIIAILIRLILGAPVIFKQKRPGFHGRIFTLYKFRTMTEERGGNGELLPDAERLSEFGKWLRSTSLDELPELFNILKGDLAIIGPRPLAVQYLPFYSEREFHRHDVRPGLSGLAQVHGRNGLQWEKRFAYDIEYVNNISFLGDCRIIIQTAIAVLERKDVSIRGTDGMLDFDVYRKKQWEKQNESGWEKNYTEGAGT